MDDEERYCEDCGELLDDDEIDRCFSCQSKEEMDDDADWSADDDEKDWEDDDDEDLWF